MERQAGGHPHVRPRRRQAEGGPRRARARRPQPGARTAGGALLPRRAAAASSRSCGRILRASRYGNVQHPGADARVGAREIEQTLALIAQAKEIAARAGRRRSTADIKVGGMIEIPAAVLAIGVVPRAARLPLDRHQRPHPVHAGRRPRRRCGRAPVRPAASGGAAPASRMAITAANRAGVPVAVCGEMAGEVRLTRLLLGLGLHRFLDAPGAPPVGEAAGAGQ